MHAGGDAHGVLPKYPYWSSLEISLSAQTLQIIKQCHSLSPILCDMYCFTPMYSVLQLITINFYKVTCRSGASRSM